MSFRAILCLFVYVLLVLQVRAKDDIDLAHVADLRMSVRAHRESLVLGDPLYLEVEIVNRGKDTVRAPSFSEFNLEFRAVNTELGIETDCLLGSAAVAYGDVGRHIVDYLPDQPRREVFLIFLPKIRNVRHPFWIETLKHGNVSIKCHFWLKPHLQLISDQASVQIVARAESELQALERWSQPPKEPRNKLETSVLFGSAGLLGVRTRQATKHVAEEIKSGEFAELAKYVLRMQELEFSDNRETDSKSVVEWVRAQPDIKRQWLALRLSGSHQGLFSASALKDLKEIASGPSP